MSADERARMRERERARERARMSENDRKSQIGSLRSPSPSERAKIEVVLS